MAMSAILHDFKEARVNAHRAPFYPPFVALNLRDNRGAEVSLFLHDSAQVEELERALGRVREALAQIAEDDLRSAGAEVGQ